MNCSRFRFLIQQRFDMDIAPQDERMVGAHLESCESCAKFHHQLQQVIMAAEEVPLPDEMSPSPPEALARNIMEGLPQPKSSPFSFITKLFAKKEKELPTSIDRGGDRGSQTKFPHVNRGAQAGADGSGMGMDAPRKEMAMPTGKQKDEDHSGTSNRLRALAKGPVENREAQSTTRSLGEKLGFAAPAGGSLTDDQPLTLAESIRRKISEKPAEAEEEEMAMAPPVPPQPAAVDDSWGSPASSPSRAPANMASPPNIPGNRPQPAQISGGGQPEGQTVLGSWGKPSPIESGNNWGGQQGAAAAQSMSRDDWNFDANANQQGAQQMAPQARGGSIDPFAAPGQATSNPNMQAPSADSWGGWNDASAPKGASAGEGDSDWGPPPAGGAWDEPAATAAPSNSWGGTPNPGPSPAQKSLSAQQAQAQFGSGVMETGMIKLGELGLPSMPGQPGGPSGAPQPGGAPGFPQQAQAPGTAADASSPWGAAPSAPAAPQGGAADPWGSSSTDSWGSATSQNAWGTNSSPENQIPAGAGNQWGQPAGQQAQSADPFGGGGAPTGDWGEPAGAPTDSWSGGSPTGQGSWNQPAAMPGGSWDQPSADASQPAWGDSNDWSQGAQQAPQAVPEPQQTSSQAAALGKGRQQAWSLEAEQVETGTWRAFAPSGEALSSAPAQARGGEAQPAAGAPNQQSFAPQQDEQSRWDIPIQERMKQGNNSSPNLPQAPVTPPSPFAQPAFGQAQAAAAAPMATPQPQPVKPQEPLLPSDSPAPTKSGWNFPVYEAPDQLTAIPAEPKVSGSWDSPAPQPTPAAPTGLGGSWGEPPAPPQPMEQPKVSGAWDMPSAPSFSQPTPPQPVQPMAPMPGQPGASVPVDSIMDRLGNVLNNNAEAPAPAQAQPSSQWDVSIQERQQQQAAAAAAAAAPQQAASPWGQAPEPAAPPAMSGNGAGGWGAPPQPLPVQPQAPQPVGANPWDSPPAALTPPPNPFALPQQLPQPQQAPAASGWDSPMGQSPMGNPMANPSQPMPVPVPQPAVAAAPAAQPGAPAPSGGLFQNLDDNAIDRLFSENLGVSDAGAAAAAAAAPVQQAPAPAFTAPRWNPGENGGGAPAQPSFGAPTQPSFGAPPQPFGAQPAAAADAGGPKISAITPRSAAPAEPPPMPGMDRRNPSPFAMPGAAPQTMAPPQPMASPFAQPEPVPVAAAVAQPSQKNGLFDLDDSAMDELFSKNLGVNEQATPSNQAGQPQQAAAPVFQSPPVMAQQPPAPPANPFSRPAPQMAPSMPNPFAPLSAPPAQPAPPPQQPQAQPAWGQQPPAPPSMQQPPQQGGLFSIDDSMIDKIFADNAAPQPPQVAAAPQFNVNEAVKEFAEVAQNVPPPKIAGVGRLDSRTDTAADAGSGRIASIGKFLLDQKDLEKIGKLTGSDLSETKMRILTMEAAQELQTLLQHIGTQETVIGSVIVGHDGLLIANTMPPDIDAESMGVWALGLYMSTEMVIKKMGQDRVHQIVSRTPKGYVVIADFGGGLLVTVSDGKDTDTLIPLMRSITQLVAQ
ncbi:MAG: roadblock/LC7 domain-containing protein [Cyanobacteria bacterium SZAS-4]|nr:roadblock/LC7 domain-containing protein [Cyanobacteria bacterium SZAS-4]